MQAGRPVFLCNSAGCRPREGSQCLLHRNGLLLANGYNRDWYCFMFWACIISGTRKPQCMPQLGSTPYIMDMHIHTYIYIYTHTYIYLPLQVCACRHVCLHTCSHLDQDHDDALLKAPNFEVPQELNEILRALSVYDLNLLLCSMSLLVTEVTQTEAAAGTPRRFAGGFCKGSEG